MRCSRKSQVRKHIDDSLDIVLDVNPIDDSILIGTAYTTANIVLSPEQLSSMPNILFTFEGKWTIPRDDDPHRPVQLMILSY